MRYNVNVLIEYNNEDRLIYTESFDTKGDGKKVLKANLRRIYEKAYKEHNYNNVENLSHIKIKDICLYALERIEYVEVNRLFLPEEFDKISKNIGVPFINHVDYETKRANKKSKRNTSK